MSLRTRFFKWLTHGQMNVTEPSLKPYASVTSMIGAQPIMATAVPESDMSIDNPSVSLRFIKASNGNVIEVTSTLKNKHGHYDRTVEVYVVAQGDKLSEAIVQILAIKALEK